MDFEKFKKALGSNDAAKALNEAIVDSVLDKIAEEIKEGKCGGKFDITQVERTRKMIKLFGEHGIHAFEALEIMAEVSHIMQGDRDDDKEPKEEPAEILFKSLFRQKPVKKPIKKPDDGFLNPVSGKYNRIINDKLFEYDEKNDAWCEVDGFERG